MPFLPALRLSWVSGVGRPAPPSIRATCSATGAACRHELSTPGRPRISDEHYPPRPTGPAHREPRARSPEEAEFLSIGEGAKAWLVEAAAAGCSRIRTKMAEAVTLAKLHGAEAVDRALGQASAAGRFADGDLQAILAHGPSGELTHPGESHTLQPGTAAWGRLR
jgi:hypothetical protein